MRSATITVVLLLTASLLAWQFLRKKLEIQITATTAAKKNTAPNTPTAELFRAIAPLTHPGAVKTTNPISNKTALALESGPELTPTKPQTTFTPRIKQRDNTQQSHSRFEKIAFSGERLPINAGSWSCALEVESGLLWETKLSNGGVSDTNHTYSWFDPQQPTPQQGKQDGGNCYGSGCDTYAYVEEMNRMALCGSRQWRLPAFSELESLIDREFYNPTINQNIFRHAKGTVYWSSTELENNPGMVMQVDFFNGMSNAVPKNLSYPLRVVSDLP